MWAMTLGIQAKQLQIGLWTTESKFWHGHYNMPNSKHVENVLANVKKYGTEFHQFCLQEWTRLLANYSKTNVIQFKGNATTTEEMYLNL